MSRSALRRAEAREAALAFARELVAELHETEDPEGHLAGRLYQVLLDVRKSNDHARETGRNLTAARNRVGFLMKAGAVIHEQLLDVVAQRNEVSKARGLEQDAIHQDLGALLEALGLPNTARPQSPHEVMQACIRIVGQMKAVIEQVAPDHTFVDPRQPELGGEA